MCCPMDDGAVMHALSMCVHAVCVLNHAAARVRSGHGNLGDTAVFRRC